MRSLHKRLLSLAAVPVLGLGLLGCQATDWIPVQEAEDLDDLFGSGNSQPVDGPNQPSPEDCANGTDDDWDGLTDCVDPECADQEVCTQQEEVEETVTIRASFWSSYSADGAVIYQDTGELTGEVWFQRHQADANGWTVVCSSLIRVTGTPTRETDVDVGFQLTFQPSWDSDGCNLSTPLPPLPHSLGWRRDESSARAFFQGDTTAELWPILSGSVGWDDFQSAEDFFVMSSGQIVAGSTP
jgi:hypothetical protein